MSHTWTQHNTRLRERERERDGLTSNSQYRLKLASASGVCFLQARVTRRNKKGQTMALKRWLAELKLYREAKWRFLGRS